MHLAVVAAAVLGLGGAVSPAQAAPAGRSPTPAAAPAATPIQAASPPAGPVAAACPFPGTASRWTCRMLEVGAGGPAVASVAGIVPRSASCGSCLTPANLWSAYHLGNPSNLGGQTVGLVEAYDYPSMISDVSFYRFTYGLGACASAGAASCTFSNGAGIRKVNALGGGTLPPPPPPGMVGFAGESALDVDMISAVCPHCTIVVVEANSSAEQDVLTAMDEVARLDVNEISLSLGRDQEFVADPSEATAHFNHPGTPIAVAAGDCDAGPSFPAAAPGVISVGGTRLSTFGNARGWTETVWGASQTNAACQNGLQGTASGCSAFQPKPAWQSDPGCGHRTMNDISAVADPQTGVAVYDTYQNSGFLTAGGTSVAAPIIAAVYALGGGDRFGDGAANLYRNSSGFNDVTTGTNSPTCAGSYLCQAGPGYDGPSGLGTPNGLFTPAPSPPQGYWLVASDGGIFPFGNAVGRGSTGNIRLNRPVVGMDRTADAGGYWLVAADGGIFPFGDATGYGSTGNIRLNQPVVGMARTATGNGYWLVASDGGIFPFGDAVGYGSTGNLRLNQPVVGMASTADSRGYWLVAADGGIFPFGDAVGYGSTGNVRLNQPVVGMAVSPQGAGYWLVARDGGIFPFGDALGLGSTGNIQLNQPMVGMAATLATCGC